MLQPIALLLGIAFGALRPTLALETDFTLAQLIHRQWETEHGLPQNAVHCLAQDHLGFIWLGSENGLVRFDGIRFEVFTETSKPAVPHNYVSSLLVARDGTLWAGTRTGGLCHYRNGQFEIPSPLFAEAQVFGLAETPDGDIWVAAREGLLRWDGTNVQTFGAAAGLPDEEPTAVLAMRDGSVLAGTEKGNVYRLNAGKFSLVVSHKPSAGAIVRSLAYHEKTDTLWIAHDGAGLFSFHMSSLTNEPTHHDLLPGKELEFLTSLMLDAEGALWIGSQFDGVFRIKNGIPSHLSAPKDFPDNDVLSLMQDKERSVWVGTHYAGLNRLSEGKAITLTERDHLTVPEVTCVVQEDAETLWVGTRGGGLLSFSHCEFKPRDLGGAQFPPRNDVRSLLRASNGELWVGTHGGGLGRFDQEGKLHFYTEADGLNENFVSSLIEIDGDIWIGTVRNGICIFEKSTGSFRRLDVPDYMLTHIRSFARDPHGILWIGTQGGLVRCQDGTFNQVNVPGAPELSVRSVLCEADSTVWVGTRDRGLIKLSNNKAFIFTSQHGLIHNRIYHILPTPDHLYIAGNQGIERIGRADLQAVAAGRIARLSTRLYTKLDGLRTSECGNDSSPSAMVAQNGALWFGTRAGLTYLPAKTPAKIQPGPNVVIHTVTVDTNKFDSASFTKVNPGATRIQFEFTALSLRNPGNVLFEYMLEGVDKTWVQGVRQRDAVYYNLKPGDYRFRVKACDDEGVWNETGATLAFAALPFFYQTSWFRAAAASATLGLLLAGYRWRVRQIRARNKQLKSLVAERTTELQELNEELETRVQARTSEVSRAYENLQIELHQRHEAEQALARSEARLRRIVDSGMVGILFWNRDGRITDANGTFLRMVGYTQDELIAGTISWENLTPPEHLDRDAFALDEIQQTGVCTPFEKEYVRKDGSRIPILIGGASLGGDGERGVCFVLDISKLKETEEEIRQLNLRLEARVEERTTELARANEQLASEIQERKRVGVAVAAFSHLGQKLHAARTEVEAAEIVVETARSLIPHDYSSIELYNADGKLAPVFQSVEPGSETPALRCSISVSIRNGSRVVGVIGLKNSRPDSFNHADVNTLQALGDYCGGALERIHAEEARRETERRFSTFMTNAPALAWMKDARFRYVYTNAMFQRFIGMTSEQIVGKTDYDLWPDHVAFHMRTNDAEAVKSQSKLESQEQLKRFDGETRTLLSLRFLFTTSSGEQFVAGMAVDITEQKRAEEALHKLPQSIIEAQETERRRVARELHDGVNQAIASVKFRIQTAEQQILRADPKWQETCNKTKDMLDSVLQQVRRLSRNLRPGELDDFGLVAAARSATQEFELRSGVQVQFTHSDFAERLAPALELSLYRIIQEALTNIEKHSGATIVEIELHGDDAYVTLEISDNGRGFNMVEKKESRDDSGLGLLHMRERATLVGGTFSITTSPDAGTRITIQAPVPCREEVSI